MDQRLNSTTIHINNQRCKHMYSNCIAATLIESFHSLKSLNHQISDDASYVWWSLLISFHFVSFMHSIRCALWLIKILKRRWNVVWWWTARKNEQTNERAGHSGRKEAKLKMELKNIKIKETVKKTLGAHNITFKRN